MDAVQEIKARIDYEAYYRSQGIELHGSGPERTARCPFHDDRRDSLGVNVETGLYVCYACGARGDVFTFHMARYSVDFSRAKEELARFAGIVVDPATRGANGVYKKPAVAPAPPRDEKPEPPPIPEDEVMRYHVQLLGYARSMRFLEEQKGLSVDTIREYKLGYDGDRIVIPIRDAAGAVRNLRRYHPNRKPKMLPYREGYGEARFFPIEALEGDEIVIVEGEWDCMLARQALKINAVTQTGGAGTWKAEWNGLFTGKKVTICYDHDDAGREGARKVAEALAPVAAEVRVVQLPVEDEGEDLSDWILRYGGTREAWDELVAAAEVVERPELPTIDVPEGDRPKIDAGSNNLAQLAQQAWEAIKRWNNPPRLFQRGGLITTIDVGDSGEPSLAVVTESGLRGILARAAWWYRWTGSGDDRRPVDALPPVHVVKDMMAAREHSGSEGMPLPVIARLVEAPVFGADGSLRTQPGYHEGSRTYYCNQDMVIDRPDPDRLEEAKALLLDELLVDFPFVSESERAHAVAAILCPFVREMIDGPVPLHLIEAPSPGTGKSLLADAISIPATGRPAAVMTEGRDEDEWRKRITSILIAAPTYVLIDNVRRKLDSASLSAALTSTVWQDRILGRSELTKLPAKAVWLATGNNPALTTEIARRTVRIRLDAKMARPWRRGGFRHEDLRTWAKENRGRLVWAALTLVQAWIESGRPDGKERLGQYEAWARVVGGILDVCRIPGFLGNVEELYERADEETQEWEEFVAAWWERFKDRAVLVKELYDVAADQELLLSVRGDKSEQSQKIRLGKALLRMVDRQFGELKIVRAGEDARMKQPLWRLVPVGGGAAGETSVMVQGSLGEIAAGEDVDDEAPF